MTLYPVFHYLSGLLMVLLIKGTIMSFGVLGCTVKRSDRLGFCVWPSGLGHDGGFINPHHKASHHKFGWDLATVYRLQLLGY